MLIIEYHLSFLGPDIHVDIFHVGTLFQFFLDAADTRSAAHSLDRKIESVHSFLLNDNHKASPWGKVKESKDPNGNKRNSVQISSVDTR